MKIVVTGSEGFIGRHLCQRLLAVGHDVVGLDLKSGKDIRDCHLPDADRVFHLAAQTDAMSEDASADALVNIVGLLRVMERYRDKVIFASSSMVNYPTSPYAISKLAGEHYVRLYGGTVVRFCNVFGPGGHSVIDRFLEAKEITIYGDGSQIRTFAHVEAAVRLMVAAMDGPSSGTHVLSGSDYSVLEIADWHPAKPRQFAPSRPLDVLRGRQQ